MSKFRRGTASKVQSKRTGTSGAGRKAKPAARKPARPGAEPGPRAPRPASAAAPIKLASVRPRPPAGTAAILAIGDEVLRGEIANTNAAVLSDRLFDAGYDVRVHHVVSDRSEDIRSALLNLSSEAAVVVATGGLGPTEDDRTVEVVCELLGVGATEHGPSLEAMKQRFAAHGFALTPNNLRQVRVPAGAQAFPNSAGIAPGFCVTIGGAEAYFLPGIPREMESIFEGHCMPRLIARMAAQGVPKAAVRTFHIYGMGESHIDHRLVGLIEGVSEATVHFRTAAPENHVKVVVRASDAGKSQALLDDIDRELRKRIGQGIYGIDGETFPMVVGRALREAGATLALAESCTGGYAGQLLTSEPGASACFVGGVVAYSNELKTGPLAVPAEVLAEHGAVSEPCARAMAEGLRKLTGATLAVAITGVAGNRMDGRPAAPAGKTPGEKPAGTVCFSISGPRPTKSMTKLFAGDRERIRRAAAYFALDLARRYFA
jgi:nicotinamide-nucleotide amidase